MTAIHEVRGLMLPQEAGEEDGEFDPVALAENDIDALIDEDTGDPDDDFERWDDDRMRVGPGRFWRPHRVQEYPDLRPGLRLVTDMVRGDLVKGVKGSRRSRLIYFLKQVLINLYLNHQLGIGLSYSRSERDYKASTRERSYHLHWGWMKRVMGLLRRYGISEELVHGKRGGSYSVDGLTEVGARLIRTGLPDGAWLSESPVGGPALVVKSARAQNPFTRSWEPKKSREPRRVYPTPRLKVVQKIEADTERINSHNAQFPLSLPLNSEEIRSLKQGRQLQLWQNIHSFPGELRRAAENGGSSHPSRCHDMAGWESSLCWLPPLQPVDDDVLIDYWELSDYIDECHILGSEQNMDLLYTFDRLLGETPFNTKLAIPIQSRMHRTFSILTDDDRLHPDLWLCGRYSGEFQGLPEEWRESKLRWRDEDGICRPLVEVDVVGMFICLAYNLVGLPMPANPYRLPGEFSPERLEGMGLTEKQCRQLVKYPTLILLGARKTRGGNMAARAYIEANFPQAEFAGLDPKAVVRSIRRRHRLIADLFCRHQGIRLMRYESDIATKVMLRYVDEGHPGPILCVHDSFLGADGEALKRIIKEVYLEVMGFPCEVH